MKSLIFVFAAIAAKSPILVGALGPRLAPTEPTSILPPLDANVRSPRSVSGWPTLPIEYPNYQVPTDRVTITHVADSGAINIHEVLNVLGVLEQELDSYIPTAPAVLDEYMLRGFVFDLEPIQGQHILSRQELVKFIFFVGKVLDRYGPVWVECDIVWNGHRVAIFNLSW